LPPVLRRRDGTLEHLAHGGLALGLTESTGYDATTTTLEPGDLLLLYSDGITEAESPSGVPFDEEGLLRIVTAAPDATAPDLAGRVMAAVSAHAHDHRFADDLTVLILRRLPPLPWVAA
jgi:sigma-B regulation protein RsbU (phosphoserine phosphatase)